VTRSWARSTNCYFEKNFGPGRLRRLEFGTHFLVLRIALSRHLSGPNHSAQPSRVESAMVRNRQIRGSQVIGLTKTILLIESPRINRLSGPPT
jgi:hypothetical protein